MTTLTRQDVVAVISELRDMYIAAEEKAYNTMPTKPVGFKESDYYKKCIVSLNNHIQSITENISDNGVNII